MKPGCSKMETYPYRICIGYRYFTDTSVYILNSRATHKFVWALPIQYFVILFSSCYICIAKPQPNPTHYNKTRSHTSLLSHKSDCMVSCTLYTLYSLISSSIYKTIRHSYVNYACHQKPLLCIFFLKL